MTLRTFWGRRARRLLPAVLTLLVVVALWVAAFGTPAELDGVRRDGPWALFYLANWHFIADAGGYWQSFTQASMFDHLWSLAIEEQFYLVWPLVILVIWRCARRPHATLFFTCLAGIVVSFVLMLVLYRGGDPTRVYMGTDTRAASLLAGALAATAPGRRAITDLVRRLGGALDAIVVVLGALVLWSWSAVDGASSASLYRGGLLVHSLACALLVGIVATVPSSSASRALGWRPLAWIGVMSYGLYLWHWPVYVVLSPERTGWDGLALLVPRLAVSTVLAVLSYHLVEDPIRRHAAWARTSRGMLALGCSIAAVALVLGLLPTPATQIAAFDPASVGAAAPATTATADTVAPAATTTVAPTTAAATTAAAAAPVATTAPTAAPTTTVAVAAPTTVAAPPTTVPPPQLGPIGHAVWAGDSVAYDLAPAVAAALGAGGVDLDVTAAFVGLRMVHPEPSNSLSKAMRVRLESGADTVILQLSTWDGPTDEADQRRALTYARDLVLSHDARLVVVGAPPVVDEATNTGDARMAAIAQELAAGDPTHVAFLDPTPVWGPSAVLDLDGDGTPERKRDLVHVCPSGAARFALWLSNELAMRFSGVTPTDPTTWAAGSWVTDKRYDMPVGTCAPV